MPSGQELSTPTCTVSSPGGYIECTASTSIFTKLGRVIHLACGKYLRGPEYTAGIHAATMPVYDPAAWEQFRQNASVAAVSRHKGRRYSVDSPLYVPPPRRNSRQALLEEKPLLKATKHGAANRHSSLAPTQWLNAVMPMSNFSNFFSKANGTYIQTDSVLTPPDAANSQRHSRHRASLPDMSAEAASTCENSPSTATHDITHANIYTHANLAESAKLHDATCHSR